MTEQPPPYTAILPTILCQQPAVILHWLKTERATGNLPVEVVLDCIIEVLSRQNPNVLYFDGTTYLRNVTTSPTAEEQLEVYKRVVKTLWPLALKHIDAISGLRAELEAVNQLESKERE